MFYCDLKLVDFSFFQASSFSSITDSTMSLNIITVTLNMGKYIIVIFSVIECDSHPCIRAEEIHAGLVRLGPISFKKSRKFLFTFPWTSTMYKVNALFV